MDDFIWVIPAKTDPDGGTGWLPLVFHLWDTAEVAKRLLLDWLPDGYWRNFGLSREELENLTVLAALLHDIGKATPCFAWRITDRRLDLRERLARAGFEIQAFYESKEQIPHPLAGAEILRTAGFDEGLASVISAHHGRPESFLEADGAGLHPKSLGWKGNGDQNTPWGRAQKELIQWALDQVGRSCPEDVPGSSMTVLMQISALVIMADWIASNTAYFPLLDEESQPRAYDTGRIDAAWDRLKLSKPWRVLTDWQTPDFFERRFGFAANGVQRAVIQTAREVKTPGVMILEAPMGQGKTEAALAAAEILMNRFSLGGAAFFLPSQATSNAMFSRVTRWAENQPDAKGVSTKLFHGQAELNEAFRRLEEQPVPVGQGEGEESLTVHSFFRGRKTGLLANLVVGTVDQLLMAALQQKHVMLRHLGLAGKVVIIDECHAYDAYMNVYLDRILDWLGAYGVPVILLSATLPGPRRGALLQAYLGKREPAAPEIQECEEYPLLSWTEGDEIHCRPIPAEGTSRRVKLLRAEEDRAWALLDDCLKVGCAGIIVNTVKRAQDLGDRLRERYENAGIPVTILVDHSQFLAPDRLDREREILDRVGKHSDPDCRRGVLVIGTQVLEQSLDLDFDLLITDLCPMDLLLQRIGRLHRHLRQRPGGFEEARCIVLGAEGELEAGTKAIYGEYLLLRTRDLLPEEIRLPEDISPLVQRAYNEVKWDTGGEYEVQKEKYLMDEAKKKSNAGVYRLERPSRPRKARRCTGSLTGLLDREPGTSEAQAQAAVRDGSAPIEVLVVQRTEGEEMRLLSGKQKGICVHSNAQPSQVEAESIAAQRLRLPGRFKGIWCVDRVLEELERQTRTYLPLWRQAPMLVGELFLILDQMGQAELAGEILYYDPETGLREKEEARGGNGV